MLGNYVYFSLFSFDYPHQIERMRRPDLDVVSSRSSSAVSSRGVSEGQSSASGASDTTDAPIVERRAHQSSARSAVGDTTSIALEAATAHCSMCDDAISSLLCTQCGRLSFCAACCISLHDNKFLATHKLLSLEPRHEGEIVTVAMLKERVQKKALPQEQLPPQQRDYVKQQQSSPVQPTAPSTYADPAAQLHSADEEANIDMAALAADRNIIQARLVELSSCRSLLQASSDSLSKERFRCKDIAHTATEAVRQRFDVLRSLITEKENAYVAVVERAARNRLEDATKASFDASASLAECDAFLDQTKLQLDRLSSNKKLFAEARASLLLATDAKLRSVDDTIQRLQNDYDRIVTVSLGVQIPLERIMDEVTKLSVPTLSQAPYHSEMHAKPIAVEKFASSPGVKVIRQTSAEPTTSTIRATGSELDISQQQRKSYQQEIETLRNTPLKDIRAQQQSNNLNSTTNSSTATSSKALPLSLQSTGKPIGGGEVGSKSSTNAIARIAEKYATQQQQGGGGGAPMVGRRSVALPKELESLRQVIASTSASSSSPSAFLRKQSNVSVHSAARAYSPISASRADSPSGSGVLGGSRRASPMRQTQLSSYRNSISPSRRNPDATPGPGAYYKPTDFTARSMLSTPPRRR
ncbi:chromosome segregation ATPase-like protein, putative [Bodo saltans]|uniref:Chromosome segregation ATPase-like protein, putative n=1 Tax=Bodo saltans TaxID=75058 RepID=A0A0S4JIE1_BODSA|nr:chromosome segregation ATPase-like protein, putative [Bodo saltans]|eukprot:CUG89933.1 chromosome segregation ATPase-like protein, putative [Bodo saltans]